MFDHNEQKYQNNPKQSYKTYIKVASQNIYTS